MSKRTQKGSGEERVTAKSRPMMSLIARAPSTLSSSASKSPGKRSYESQSPLSKQAEKYDRTGRPVVCPQGGARAQQFIIGDDGTELDLSLGSRSFLDRVNDQVQKKTKTIFDECYRRRRKTFCVTVNVHVFHIGVICLRGKELLRQLAFHQEYKRSHNETNVRHIRKIGVRTR